MRRSQHIQNLKAVAVEQAAVITVPTQAEAGRSMFFQYVTEKHVGKSSLEFTKEAPRSVPISLAVTKGFILNEKHEDVRPSTPRPDGDFKSVLGSHFC